MAAADFNGDHRIDIAVSAGKQGIRVALNRGDGTLDTPMTFAGSAERLVAADVNGDGKVDLIASVSEEPRLAVFSGAGDGTFLPPSITELPEMPHAVDAIADVNHDGCADLLLVTMPAGEQTSRLILMLGSTTGLTIAHAWVLPYKTLGVAVVDVNGDGKLDLAAGSDNQIDTFLGDGSGDFAAPTSRPGSLAWPIQHADLDHDGRPEWIRGAGVLLVVRNGDSETTTYPLPDRALEVAVADVNGDGLSDVVATMTEGASVLLGQPGTAALKEAGTFQIPLTERRSQLTDATGDGKKDLITSNNDGTVSIIAGRGDGTFDAPIVHRLPPGMSPFSANTAERAVCGDFDGDGFADAAVIADRKLVFFYGDGKGGIREMKHYPTPTGLLAPTAIVAADLDRDGRTDVIVPDFANVNVMYGISGGPVPSSTIVYRYAGLWGIASIDGDGRNALRLDGNRFVPINRDRTAAPVILWPYTAPTFYGDQDGDGLTDGIQMESLTATVFISDGEGSFHTTSFHEWNAPELFLADFDGDQKDEAVGSFQTIRHTGVYQGYVLSFRHSRGNGEFDAPLYVSKPRSTLRFFSDLDRRSGSEAIFDQVVLWNQGDYSFDATAAPSYVLATADFNNDGTEDLLVPTPGGIVIALTLRTGSGALATSITARDPLKITYGAFSYVPFEVTAATGAVTGAVVFREGTRTLGVALATENAAALPLGAGDHTITLEYTGDSNFAPASTTVHAHVDKAAPDCTLYPRGNAARFPVPFELRCGKGVDFFPLTGTLTVKVAGKLVASTTAASETTFTLSMQKGAPQTLTLAYSGDENHLPQDFNSGASVYDPPIAIEKSTLDVVSEGENTYRLILQLRDDDGQPLNVPAKEIPVVEFIASRPALFGHFRSDEQYKGNGRYENRFRISLGSADAITITAMVSGKAAAKATFTSIHRRSSR